MKYRKGEKKVAEKETCPVGLKPMEEWIKEEDPDNCRPCMLGPVVQWYDGELKERGKVEMATNLEAVADATDINDSEQVLTLCKELDKIKNAVEVPLRERLEDFDCAAQSFDPDATAEE
jgi:hypothetical protein